MQVRGRAAGVTVMDDYGHHPTEIAATLDAVRLGRWNRVLVLFQPHRYTRTQALMEEFAQSFHMADRVFVTGIYAASEPPIPGVTAEALSARMAEYGHRGVQYVGTLEAGEEVLVREARDGDLILTLGAGSVSQAGERILRALEEKP
jgi:UDP-N-acetylmuramate--alanine ligase